MQSTLLKQAEYNQRVIDAEDEIAGINVGGVEFLSELSADPAEPLVVCVNGSEEMKRNEEAIGGQLWMQSGRQMTASNKVAEGMTNTRESAILSAAAEAVTWRHALELEDSPRKGQRIVIYPKDLPQLEQVLSTGDQSIDNVDGHEIAYEAILQEAQSFENPPRFLREDSEEIINDPTWSGKISEGMNLAAQVATGNRRRILEDGPDKIKSDDEDIEDMKSDEEKNMYTPDMDPSKGPVRLSQAQVAAQKAAAQAQKESRVPPRSQSPATGSSDDDDPKASKYVWSQSKHIYRRNKHWIDSEAQKAQPIIAPKPKNAAASQRAPAVQRPVPEAKASKPVNGQENPETKVSKPMEPRRQAASGAGGLRSGGGLGQTDTCVAQGNPSKT
jgi:hypothetical protein